MPALRTLARRHRALVLDDVRALLTSPWHEDRLTAMLILVEQFQWGDAAAQQAIFDIYLEHTAYVNNWDLVDNSAPHIVGGFLADKDTALLDRLAASSSLWERRIAILATFYFIQQDRFAEALHLAEMLLDDPEDLIHKAVGWMLREVGKRNRDLEEAFLRKHYHRMPRTMLRYAIERFPEPLRQQYLKGTM